MARILVIEDDTIHQEAARQQLVDHELTILSSCTEFSKKYYEKDFLGSFDVVLTDINLPSTYDYNKEVLAATGFAIAFKVLQLGVKKVGIITDADHHHDAISEALDMFRGSDSHCDQTIEIGDARIYLEAYYSCTENEEGSWVKDWKTVTEKLLGTYVRPPRKSAL